MNTKQKTCRILFCLTLVTALAISLVYAKYVKEVAIQSQMGTNDFAQHHLYLTGNNSESILLSNLNPGSKVSIPFSVSNGKVVGSDNKVSDVDMNYKLSVITTNHLPLKFIIKDSSNQRLHDPVEESLYIPYSNQGKHYTFYSDSEGNSLVFTKDSLVKRDYILEVEWPINENDFKYTKEVEQLFIEVVGEQAKPQ